MDSESPEAPTEVSVSTGAPQRRQTYKVRSATGQEIELQHLREKRFFETARDKYVAENVFTAASDLRGLDRLLLFETQVLRWQWQLAAGIDYDLVELDVKEQAEIRRSIKETEALISQLQNDLSLTKAQRDKALTGDDVGQYLKNLQIRAKQFGVRRDAQIGKAIELLMETFSIAGSYQRSTEHERRKLGFETADDVLDWVMTVAKPQFDEIDAAFRKNQTMWVRTL